MTGVQTCALPIFPSHDTPTKDAYKSLAMSYVLPTPYRESYEGVAEGLGKYHYDAICIWADKNLH